MNEKDQEAHNDAESIKTDNNTASIIDLAARVQSLVSTVADSMEKHADKDTDERRQALIVATHENNAVLVKIERNTRPLLKNGEKDTSA